MIKNLQPIITIFRPLHSREARRMKLNLREEAKFERVTFIKTSYETKYGEMVVFILSVEMVMQPKFATKEF